MRMISVTSSNVEAVGYDPATKAMRVTFKGGLTYHHDGVDDAAYRRFMASPSKGSHYHDHFKDKHGARKV